MQPFFSDTTLQHRFDRDGFVVIDLLDDDRVAELRAFYDELPHAPVPAHGFQVSLDNDSREFVRRVSERLQAAAEPGIARHFANHQIITGSFVTKSGNPLGVVPPHQDWTFVDESRFYSATIWCPLVDVNVDNGALALLKGSHLLYDHVRPSPSPQYAPPFTAQLLTIFPYMSVVPLRAGQALVFNNQTLHASPPNTTRERRLAFGVGVTHREAQLVHYYLLPGQPQPIMEAYEVTPAFFLAYNNARLSALYEEGERPSGLKSIGTFPVRARHYATADLVQRMEAAGNRRDESLVARAAALAPRNAAEDASSAQTNGVARPTRARANDRPLWRIYTPANIVREIRYRLGK